jgi:hypothetical protein
MYEQRHHDLLPIGAFAVRVGQHLAASVGIVATALAVGTLGFRWLEAMAWPDAFLWSAMLVAGMGPVGAPSTVAGKLFAAFFGLGCGLVLVVATGLVAAPVIHRILHRFHLES